MGKDKWKAVMERLTGAELRSSPKANQNSGAHNLVRRSGECVITFANAHSITAFHILSIISILFFL